MSALNAALVKRSRVDVHRHVAELLRLDAPLQGLWRSLAAVSRRDGAFGHARGAMQAYVRQSGHAPRAAFEQAALLAEIGDVSTAAAILKGLPPDVPDPATYAHLEGILAQSLGDLALAQRSFTTALKHRPQSGHSWLSYSDAMRGKDATIWAPTIIAAGKGMDGAPPPEQAAFSYALGAALDALQDYDAAYLAFAKGADIVRRTRRYDRAEDARAAAAARTVRRIGPRTSGSSAPPIFVFGPPRSGTTLVEQILAAHSDVFGGGELGLVDLIAEDVGGLTQAHLDAAARSPGLGIFGCRYRSLLDERFGQRGRIVDKTLSTTRFAGLVAAILPEAPLIWVRRDPLNVAWSCFRTFFSKGMSWSWDQQDIAFHLRAEQAMLEHWQNVLGSRLFVLRYEDLIEHPASTISALLRHCALKPEASVFEPHKSGRVVLTASVTQVREPINRKGLLSANPYNRHLQPFIEAFVRTGGVPV